MPELMWEDIKTLEDLILWIRKYETDIFVRDIGPDNRVKTFNLSEITPEQYAKHVACWIENGQVPHKVGR